ncbi:MAG: 30S ribosomal protein S12 methylthiotransferase RimO [Lachnospiraceae bacterium]|nr:30S ribosomal protein S12 methylthiotransferase RimO [Lachnospiraceae bacterium]MCI1423448.1 30S ribosomal protein S12 methylthiotransferase RimO [Lachnospiraceae bacterium]MCI1451897.1 30S ribosomal protein S12 methylthiotransferase RimO [Lachnospiraceae bacterium]MDD5849326.1 30S ribosomal protein S12 methylthiotransferase RimO [Bacillota bacterium]
MKVMFVSLGCDKNLVDSQKMMGVLRGREGAYTFTDEPGEAEAAVVNTCCFIDSAKEESIGEILDTAKLKATGKLKYLVVTGCLAQRYQEEIRKEIPEVDAVVGTTAEKSLADILDAVQAGNLKEDAVTADLDETPDTDTPQVLSLGSTTGYLKIAEGCNKCCTYCVIPSVRGHYRSVPMEEVLEEAKRLADGGVTELILVAQETTLYGTDLYGKKMLPELLRRLCLIRGFHWIRILYCYPEEITKELVQVVKEEEKVLPYFDMPIQHCNDRILKLMGRHTNRKELEEIIAYIRSEIPDACLRTSLITGFPTETEEEHKELLDFVRRMKFDRLGVFAYSREDGTPASKMKPQVHPSTKKRRRKELMLAQQENAFAAAKALVGTLQETVIEGRLVGETADDGADVYVGRTKKDIPGVDSNIYVETRRSLLSGDFVPVRVRAADGYDLIGGIEDESAE